MHSLVQPHIRYQIRKLRYAMKLTQEEFATQLGVACLTVNRWENGRAKPSPLALKRIEEMQRERGARDKDLLGQYPSLH